MYGVQDAQSHKIITGKDGRRTRQHSEKAPGGLETTTSVEGRFLYKFHRQRQIGVPDRPPKSFQPLDCIGQA
jgi:hypothetical protein